jgi:LemA protein
MSKGLIVLLAIVGVIVLLAFMFFGQYVDVRNTLVTKTVFGDIAKARSALLSAGTPQEKIAANGQLDGALGRLLVVVENYPQLKSNENFLRLQDELAGTENRIAVERKRYNDALQDYNTYVQLFPHNIFAGWAGFKPNSAYFAASEGSREVPKVNFSTPAPQTSPQPAPAR